MRPVEQWQGNNPVWIKDRQVSSPFNALRGLYSRLFSEEEVTEHALHRLSDVLVSDVLENPDGSPANLVDGLSAGLLNIAQALKLLGLADASTPFGAIEALSMEVKEGSTRIAEGLHAIADAIAEQGS